MAHEKKDPSLAKATSTQIIEVVLLLAIVAFVVWAAYSAMQAR